MVAWVEHTYSAPAAAAPAAEAASPSGWAMRWYAMGATSSGVGTWLPSRVVAVATSVTSRSTRGRSRSLDQAARLSATVRSASAPPAMKS